MAVIYYVRMLYGKIWQIFHFYPAIRKILSIALYVHGFLKIISFIL